MVAGAAFGLVASCSGDDFSSHSEGDPSAEGGSPGQGGSGAAGADDGGQGGSRGGSAGNDGGGAGSDGTGGSPEGGSAGAGGSGNAGGEGASAGEAGAPSGGTGGSAGMCSDDETPCDGACVNTLTSNEHCGGCDRPCSGGGRSCRNGECLCGDGQDYCESSCVDVVSNPAHCGNCTTVCTSGSCSTRSCTPGYGFETGPQGWVWDSGSTGTTGSVSQSAERQYAGQFSLKITTQLNASGGFADGLVHVLAPPDLPIGTAVTFHLWVPNGSTVTAASVIQCNNFSLFDALNAPITRGGWSSWTHVVPGSCTGPVQAVGLQVNLASGAFSGAVYLDAITW